MPEGGKKSGLVAKLDGFFEEGELSGIKFFHSSFPTWFRGWWAGSNISELKMIHSRFRLTWIVCMFAFLGMMIYQLTDLILQFKENPLSMDISRESRATLKLPSLLACPHNQVRLSKAAAAGGVDVLGLARRYQAGTISQQNMAERMAFAGDNWPADQRRLLGVWTSLERHMLSDQCTLTSLEEKLAEYRNTTEQMRLKYLDPIPLFGLNHTLSSIAKGVDKFISVTLRPAIDEGQSCVNLSLPELPASSLNSTADVLNGVSFGDFLRSASSEAHDFIVSCRYKDEEQIPCQRNWTAVETIFGRCFLLNMSAIHVSRAGIDNALTVHFDSAASDAAFKVDAGMSLSLIPEGRPAIVMEPLELNPGYNLHLPLRYATQTSHSSQCSEEPLRIVPEYSRSACMLQNFLNLCQEKCGCTPFSGLNIGPADCSIAKEFGCIARLRNNLTNVWDSSKCKVACSEKRYESYLSYSTDDAVKAADEVALHDVPLSDDELDDDQLDDKSRNGETAEDPQAYGEEWRNRTKWAMKLNADLMTRSDVREALQKPSAGPVAALTNDIYREVWYPMFNFSTGRLLFALFYHGSEFGAWPLQRKDFATEAVMRNMSRCLIKDLIIPVPPTFQRNYTAYLAANCLSVLKTAVPGAKATGKVTLLGEPKDWIRVLVGALNTSVALGQAEGKADEIAEKLLPLALPYQACVRDIDCTVAKNTKDPKIKYACWSLCQAELDPLGYALEGAVQLRDIAFLTMRYEKELQDALRIFGTWYEGISRPYLFEFLQAEFNFTVYYEKSELEHSEYFVENFGSWEAYLYNVRDKVKSVRSFLDFMTTVTEPKNIKLVFDDAKLNLSSDYDRFFQIYGCLEHYQYVWSGVSKDMFLKGAYQKRMKSVLTRAKSLRELSSAGPTYFRRNVMSLTIYLAEMTERVSKQRLAYDFWSMLSDVGGTISFYVGGTIITFFEIFFMCTDCHKRRKLELRITKKRERAVAGLTAVTAFKMAAAPVTDSRRNEHKRSKIDAQGEGRGGPAPSKGSLDVATPPSNGRLSKLWRPVPAAASDATVQGPNMGAGGSPQAPCDKNHIPDATVIAMDTDDFTTSPCLR